MIQNEFFKEQLDNEYRYFCALSKHEKMEYLQEFAISDNLKC